MLFFSCGLLVSASAQINLLSNSITFRNVNNAANETYHYGDLHLEGATSGESWGWLYTNRLENNGYLQNYGPAVIHNTLSVQNTLSVDAHAYFYNGIVQN